MGHVDNVQEEIIKADCLILPSYREGLSKVLIEAGSSGLPCVTTDVPGCRDVIINDYNGLIIRPKDSESLLMAMNKMLNHSRQEISNLGVNARKNIEEKFSLNTVNTTYINEIKKVITHNLD